MKSFMQACAPLILRDELVFLRALACTVQVAPPGSESTSSLSSSRGSQVTLLSNEQRIKSSKLLGINHRAGSNGAGESAPTAEKSSSQDEQPKQRRGRSKSPHRASLCIAKKSTPNNKANTHKNHFQLAGTPANHVTSLLLKEIICATHPPPNQPFLSTVEHLNILSELVLAIPACGAAVHKFKLPTDLTIANAIPHSPDPPQTAVSYLLHKLLPLPRTHPKEKAEKKQAAEANFLEPALNKTKSSQAAARLLVCLVARSGEGRRRVISELVSALSCGKYPAEKKTKNSEVKASQQEPLDEDAQMWALQSWGELCMGISAPRSGSASSLTSSESNSVLSFEVVKLMLDYGAAHALVAAIEKISLQHPMASTTAATLVKPLEIFTRGSVFSTVMDMAEKEKVKQETAKTSKDSRRTTFGPSQRSESAIYDYDAALDNAFDANSADSIDASMDDSDDEDIEDSDDSMEGDSSDDDDDDDDEMLEVPPIDYSGDDDSASSPEDEEISSDSSSDEMEEDESDEENSVDIDDGDAPRDEDLFSDDDEEEEAEVGEFLENNEFFDENVEDDANNGVEAAAAAAAAGNEEEEGWTSINGGRGLGSVLLDMVQPGRNGRQNGAFLMDAAETMLGNMLRGDMGLEGLSEIEDTLGIRVVRGDQGGGRGHLASLAGHTRTGASTGRATQVHQNGPSHGGSSMYGGPGLMEFSPMEFVYGYDILTPSASERNGPGRELLSHVDTQLFPGGHIAASNHSRFQSHIHPLLQSIQLPPINSLRSRPYGAQGDSLQEQSGRTVSAPGSYIAGANGNIIRVNDRLHTHDRASRQRAASDEGLSDVAVAIGESLVEMRTFLQDQVSMNNTSEGNAEETENRGDSTENPADETEALGENLGTNANEEAQESGDAPPGDRDVSASQDEQPPDGEAHSETADATTRTESENTHAENNADNADVTTEHPAEDTGNDENEEDVSDNNVAQEEVAAPSETTAGESNTEQGGEAEPAENTAGDNNAEQGEEAVSSETGAQEAAPPEGNAVEADATKEEGVPADEDQSMAQPEAEGEEAPAEADTPNETVDSDANNDDVPNEESGETNNEENGESNQEPPTCPPDIDPEVFASLPLEMQQEIVQQAEESQQISESGLDPEALAALPEELRREIIEQEQQEQRLREQHAAQPAADPANAEDMDNASFLASLAPDLRQEILLTADDAFIASLPPTLIAEANVLRERVASQHRRRQEEANNAANAAAAGLGVAGPRSGSGGGGARPAQPPSEGGNTTASSRVRRQRNGKLRVESDRKDIVYPPEKMDDLGPLLTKDSAKALLSLFYLLSPVQPQRVIHKLMLNMCMCDKSRGYFLSSVLALLSNNKKSVMALLESLNSNHNEQVNMSEFPPSSLIGVIKEIAEENNSRSRRLLQQGENSTATVIAAASLPISARGLSKSSDGSIPPVVARRIISMCVSLCKASPRVAFSILANPDSLGVIQPSGLELLLDLIGTDQYIQSATSLEQLLSLLEIVLAPLSLLPKEDQEIDLSSDRSSPGREWIKVPRVVLSKRRLHLLINILRLESCRDSSFLKVNTLTRRLSRVEANRECILEELALVAEGLGKAAILDLKAVSVRLSSAAKHHRQKLKVNVNDEAIPALIPTSDDDLVAGSPSSAVSLSTSSNELKLLRVLQMLSSLCAQDEETKSEGNPPEFVSLLHSLKLESLWDQLSDCMKMVSVLEGCNIDADETEGDGDEEDNNDNSGKAANGQSRKKLQNSVAGLITRFLPAVEAFFMVNASSTESEINADGDNSIAADNSRVVQFAASNKILLNALLRSNPQLLEKGLKAMVKMPDCRIFLDFDVKRHWFKTQVRRLRQQASRRHGSFRLNLRRKQVFEDSFHAFIHRNADELRGRLHITFAGEEGVDAGGPSREFFAILAKDMFNPNYALFMSTEDGCTFQPNPNSSINPDDLRYFRFVGRIVGKAVVDGFLLDAHFTRSLYKHMLGVKPTHHDMQAIDPDYYKNLQMILEHNLEDIGLELTFSTEDHSFGRSRIIDLIPDGRNIPVTEETKDKYVDLVCQHRMTTAIEKQIKAYLEGFHEMVDHDLISIFTAKELELLISGMPEIDIHDLKKNTDYNGYRPADKEIGWFWSIMFDLTRSEKAAFLQFVTGSSKVPLAGFGELVGMRGVQKFSICKASSGPSGALMSAHTCFNALDLPVYKSEEEMKEKLLYAISEGGTGFGFA